YTYYKKGFKNNSYDGKCLAHIIRFRIMVTSLLNGITFKEAMLLNKDDRCYLKQIKYGDIIYDYNKAYNLATNEINTVEKLIFNQRNIFPDFNQKMYDYLNSIIENIIKDNVFSVNNLSS
ncbi:MAG: hypothetical protein LUG46_02935, partial [Erysipelotrichaceae bacterium]|nr:hypothetical protein [Erysipelotrichaceae bacterium]